MSTKFALTTYHVKGRGLREARALSSVRQAHPHSPFPAATSPRAHCRALHAILCTELDRPVPFIFPGTPSLPSLGFSKQYPPFLPTAPPR